MGSPWLGMGSYFGKTEPRAPGRFLDTSEASGIPYKIKKWLLKSKNAEIPYFTLLIYIYIYIYITPDQPPMVAASSSISPTAVFRILGTHLELFAMPWYIESL